MKKFLKLLIILFTSIGFVSFVFVLFNDVYFNTSFAIDPVLASKFGDFFGGYIGSLFSILSVLLLIYSSFRQNTDKEKNEVKNRFFKMVDYHNNNVAQINISPVNVQQDFKREGRRAFGIFKIQIRELLQLVAAVNKEAAFGLDDAAVIDISYILFYYGLSNNEIGFTKEKLQEYPRPDKLTAALFEKIDNNPKLELGRANQTSLSVYFRNMYHAIKLVDDSEYLSEKEKKDLVKIYRTQLSNPELYVLFFNLVSRFGTGWRRQGFVMKYSLLKNIPKGYCDGYSPAAFFPMEYEEGQ